MFYVSKMKLDNQSIQYITLFETLTHTSVKDCFLNNGKIFFIVNPGNAAKAIGHMGKNIRKIESLTKKKVKIAEFSTDPVKFLTSFLYPIMPQDIKIDQKNNITIQAKTTQDRGILIGRDKKNLNYLKLVLQKYFKVGNINII